jgi:hypothetical protein
MKLGSRDAHFDVGRADGCVRSASVGSPEIDAGVPEDNHNDPRPYLGVAESKIDLRDHARGERGTDLQSRRCALGVGEHKIDLRSVERGVTGTNVEAAGATRCAERIDRGER